MNISRLTGGVTTTDRQHAGAVAATLAMILAGYYFGPEHPSFFSQLFQYLLFVPLMMAAMWFGMAGAVVTAVITSLCVLPGLLFWWTEGVDYSSGRFIEVVDLLFVGVIVGALGERERRQTKTLRTATDELNRTYQELQGSLQRLRQAERLSAVGQLTANLAHEIRNPLTGIAGAADVLQQENLPEQTRLEFSRIVKKESQRLHHLLTDMLEYARTKPLNPRRVALQEMLTSVRSLSASMAAEVGVTIRADLDAPLPSVECDPDQIEQVLLNLIVNAIEAMRDRGGQVEIRPYVSNQHLIVEISDQGPGVAPDQIDRLFSPFFTTKKGGSGLGLPIAQQIISAHGGEITVSANSQQGAVFSIMLPINAAQDEKRAR